MLEILGEIFYIIGAILKEIRVVFVESGIAPGTMLAQTYEATPLPGIINFWRITAYIATPILIGLIILVIKKFIAINRVQSEIIAQDIPLIESSGGALNARWQEILSHIESTNEAEWKFAVIEADKLVDDLLKSSGFQGDTMGERLMNTDKTQIVTLDGLWDAHKTRNRLVHDSNYFLRYAEAKRAITLYENTLKELGAL